MKVLSKKRIKKSFSKAAATYDEAADFQKETALRLIEKILSDEGSRAMILDAGMGTGTITRELSGLPGGHSRVYGCDMAWGMVSFSKGNTNGIFISQADAEALPYKNEVFDIVFSNITYHWIDDFKSAFSEVKRVLRQGGRFYFSILVKDTLRELDKILEIVVKRPYVGDFLLSSEYIKSEVEQAGLEITWYKEEMFKRYYKSSLDLIRTMKKVGANRILEPHLFGMGKKRLFFEMVRTYDKMFTEAPGVFATYNVILGCARKP